MSRCFPYPPPFFGQSEIESIKLLKEEKAKKHKDKAKRQKSHEKEKADGKQHKKRKHQEKSEEERSHKKQKSEKKQQLPLVPNLFSQKTSETIEQLEKSGLTEEHEHPCSIQHKLDSPESSQDSSKRRKMVSSSIHETQGSTLRIKLPSFRQRVTEPSPLPLSRQTEAQPALPTLGKVKLPSASSRQMKPQPSLPQSRLGVLPAQRQIKVRTQLPSSDQVDPTVPLSRQTRTPPSLPPSGRVELPVPLSRQTKRQPSLPPSGRAELAVPLPRQKLQPPLPELAMPLARQTKLKPPLPPAGRVMPSLPSSSLSPPTAVAEQPCSSSRPSEAAAATTKTSRSKRVGGRRWQKEQYEILVANWNPPPAMEHDETSVLCEDDDWLAVAPRQQLSPAIESSTSNATGSIQENHAVPSVQPRACYLPELNMFQLPYVVPF